MDIISTVPESIIESILCLVPLQEAARTSILSREWRYKWTKIPKLIFDDETFEPSIGKNQLSVLGQTFDFPSQGEWMIQRCQYFYAIFQVLLLHQGPLHEFTLFLHRADDTCVEIDQLIIHLSRKNTLKKLRLYVNCAFEYKLPLSLFSLHQLTHLYLQKGGIHHQPTFNGFRRLTKLCFSDVNISTKTLLHLLSNCPLLKTFTLLLAENNILGNENSTVIELLECLPVIEKLITWTWVTQCFVLDVIPRKLPISLVKLKDVCMEEMDLFDHTGLPFLILLIRCSPNLEKLTLEIHEPSSTDPDIIEIFEKDPIKLDGYSDIVMHHLSELEMIGFVGLKLPMEFVQLILAKSPVLKKVGIWLHSVVTKDEEANILGILSRSQRASPVAEIVIKRCG